MPNDSRKRKRKKSTFLRRSEKAKEKASKRMEKIARTMVRKQKDVGPIDEILAKARRENIGRLHVRRSRDAYHEAIGLALKLMYAVSASADQNGELTKLAEGRPFKVTAKTTPQLIVVRATLEYDATEKVRRAEERRASRDAAAIHHLFLRDIDPEDVVELGKKKGEGVEAWARAGSATVPKARAGKPPKGERRPGSSQAGTRDTSEESGAEVKKATDSAKATTTEQVVTEVKLGASINKSYQSIRLAKRHVLFSPGSLATITVKLPNSSPNKKPRATFRALVEAIDARLEALANELDLDLPERTA